MSRKRQIAGDWVSAAGRVFEFTRALSDAVRAKGGSDADLDRARQDEKKIDRIAELIMAGSSAIKNSAAMIVADFTTRVNYGDARWSRIDRARYYFVNDALTVDRLPIRESRVGDANFVDLDFSAWNHDSTTPEILDEAERQGLRQPDRAESEVSLDIRPVKSGDRPVVCLCGSVWTGSGGGRVLGCVLGYSDGRSLLVFGLDGYWCRNGYVFRFVRKPARNASA